jgi:hypothetical protein
VTITVGPGTDTASLFYKMYFNGGITNIGNTISSAQVTTQQIAIYITGSSHYAISNISAFYA